MNKEDFMYILPRKVVQEDDRYYVLPHPPFYKQQADVRIPVNPWRDNPFAVFATVVLVEERQAFGWYTPEDLPAFIAYLQRWEPFLAVDPLVLADMSNGRIACRKNAEQVLKWAEHAHGLDTELERMHERENMRIYSLY